METRALTRFNHSRPFTASQKLEIQFLDWPKSAQDGPCVRHLGKQLSARVNAADETLQKQHDRLCIVPSAIGRSQNADFVLGREFGAIYDPGPYFQPDGLFCRFSRRGLIRPAHCGLALISQIEFADQKTMGFV